MGWIVEVVRATRVVDRTWELLSFEAVSVHGVHVGTTDMPSRIAVDVVVAEDLSNRPTTSQSAGSDAKHTDNPSTRS